MFDFNRLLEEALRRGIEGLDADITIYRVKKGVTDGRIREEGRFILETETGEIVVRVVQVPETRPGRIVHDPEEVVGRCPRCLKYLTSENAVFCEKCGVALCKAHAVYIKGKWYCPKHAAWPRLKQTAITIDKVLRAMGA